MFNLQKQGLWQSLAGRRNFRIGVGYIVVLTTLIAVVFGFTFGSPLFRAKADAVSCTGNDTAYTVADGDTLSDIASRNNTTLQELVQHNNIANADWILAGQVICIPGSSSTSTLTSASQDVQQSVSVETQTMNMTTDQAPSAAIQGTGNYFPYGQCTWWANQRYYQLHKIYVPWTTQSDAWQWSARARDFHWQVSSKPVVGAILDLQPWVQGAYSLGHVAVVEKILPNGHVLASNMNWGGNSSVVDVDFTPGAGVTFIYA